MSDLEVRILWQFQVRPTMTTSAVAEACGITFGEVEKILCKLANQGLVEALDSMLMPAAGLVNWWLANGSRIRVCLKEHYKLRLVG
jgi:hypothetical protein